MKKYLDQAGLNYLWQKIRLTFSDINHNHRHLYLEGNITGATEAQAAKGHVANWKDGDTLMPGHVLDRDVASTNYFADEATWKAAGQIITPVNKVYNIPFAGYDESNGPVNGVVTTDNPMQSVEIGSTATGYRSVPIVNGIPYYQHYIHPPMTVIGTTGEISPEEDEGSFTVVDVVGTDEYGHVTNINTKKVKDVVGVTGTFVQGTVVVGSTGKYVTQTDYTLGGTRIGATSGANTRLATEAAVNEAFSKFPVQGVTGKILYVHDQKIDTTLGINIIQGGATSGTSDRTYIVLTGTNNQEVARVDASQFVVDGMIKKVEWSTEPDERYVLCITWNTDAGDQVTKIDFAGFMDAYLAGNGISIVSTGATGSTGNVSTISVKTDNTTNPTSGYHRVTLTAGPTGLRAEIDLRGKIDKVTGASAGNIAVFDANGYVQDFGKAPEYYLPRNQVSIPDSATLIDWGGTGTTITTIDGKNIKIKIPNPDVNWVRRDAVSTNGDQAVTIGGTTVTLGSVDGKEFKLHVLDADMTQQEIDTAVANAEAMLADREHYPNPPTWPTA